jgi:hypothetical protein
MKLSELTYFILELNACIDSGKYSHLTWPEAAEMATAGDTLSYFTDHLTSDDIDLSPFEYDKAKEFNDLFKEIAIDNGARLCRKYGVENSALCYFIAMTTELIQQKKWS